MGDVLDALQSKRARLLATNPYVIGGTAALADNTKLSDPNANALWGLTKALGGGLAAGYGVQDARNDYNRINRDYVNTIQQYQNKPNELVQALVQNPELVDLAPIHAREQQKMEQEIRQKMRERGQTLLQDSLWKGPAAPQKYRKDGQEYYQRWNPLTGKMEDLGNSPVKADTEINMPGDKFGKIPNELRVQQLETPGMMALFAKNEQDLTEYIESGGTTGGYLLGKFVGASDAGQLHRDRRMLSRYLTRSIEGARPTDYDAETYRKIVEGDWSVVSPQKARELLASVREVMALKSKFLNLSIQTAQEKGTEGLLMLTQSLGKPLAAMTPEEKNRLSPDTYYQKLVIEDYTQAEIRRLKTEMGEAGGLEDAVVGGGDKMPPVGQILTTKPTALPPGHQLLEGMKDGKMVYKVVPK